MAKLKLLPCPFCGGKAKIFGNERDNFYVSCTNDVCFCALGEMYLPGDEPDHMYGDPESAAYNWNKRPETVKETITALKVGKLYLSPGRMIPRRIWISHSESGEGGDFLVKDLEPVIEKFYLDNF